MHGSRPEAQSAKCPPNLLQREFRATRIPEETHVYRQLVEWTAGVRRTDRFLGDSGSGEPADVLSATDNIWNATELLSVQILH
ncbi:MAG: hypothetical protein JO352_28025 [Chloroflexi bacterium]|nr:hypothetical protein [Chloroflexota bacterium]